MSVGFDANGARITTGDLVNIRCRVLYIGKAKPTDEFQTVGLEIFYDTYDYKVKIDGEYGTVPSCILTKVR